jgi:hypothetical protein
LLPLQEHGKPLLKKRGAHPRVRPLDLLESIMQVDETTIGRHAEHANGANYS